jgi:hypothetical protein
MSDVEKLLREAAREIEPQLQHRLKGFLGGIIRSYLPQTWVFQTEAGTASLVVERDGTTSVVGGASPHPDVTVEIPHDRLVAALKTRDATKVPPGPLTVTPHTSKGKTAFDFLRGRLGL